MIGSYVIVNGGYKMYETGLRARIKDKNKIVKALKKFGVKEVRKIKQGIFIIDVLSTERWDS